MTISNREQNEINHGKKLLETGAECIWGWNSPAGKIRFMRRVDWITKTANLREGLTVLEIGCGVGNFTEQFIIPGVEYYALDISEELLSEAKKRLQNENIKYLCQSFYSIDMPEKFDVVIGSSILHHLDIDITIRKLYDILKPGGIFAFGEPNMLNPQIMVQKNIPKIKEKMGDSPDETAFFRWHLQGIMENNGFEEIQITPRDWLHPAVPEKLIPFIQKIESNFEKIPLIKEFSGSLYISAKRPYV